MSIRQVSLQNSFATCVCNTAMCALAVHDRQSPHADKIRGSAVQVCGPREWQLARRTHIVLCVLDGNPESQAVWRHHNVLHHGVCERESHHGVPRSCCKHPPVCVCGCAQAHSTLQHTLDADGSHCLIWTRLLHGALFGLI